MTYIEHILFLLGGFLISDNHSPLSVIQVTILSLILKKISRLILQSNITVPLIVSSPVAVCKQMARNYLLICCMRHDP